MCRMSILFYSIVFLAEHSISDTSQLVHLLEVHVPLQRPIRSSALLKCLFELHPPATLYSVKWYKDGSEFFRFLPGDNPAAQAFPLPGVSVNITESTEHLVTLNDLQLESSGVYLCEVSTEAPLFHTVSGQGTMAVIGVPPTQGPRISGLRGLYMEGDMVEVNCTSSPSKPLANIMWYVNGQEANEDNLMNYVETEEKSFLSNFEESITLNLKILGLRLEACHDIFPNRVLNLKCVVQLGSQQWEQQRWTFLVHKQNSRTGSAGRSKARMQLITLPLLMIMGVALDVFM